MLSYIDVIPASERASRDEPLNVLGGAANDGDAVCVDISVWGRATKGWEALVTRRFDIRACEHKHLYFTLAPECFSVRRWGEEIEEIELLIRDREPGAEETGKMIFLD